MRRSRKQDTEETPWASFSDALSGILFVFVITTFWFALRLAVEANNARQTAERLEREKSTLTEAEEHAKDLVERNNQLGVFASCLDSSKHLRVQAERETARVSLYIEKGQTAASVPWFETCKSDLVSDQLEAAREIRACVEQLLGSEQDKYDVRIFLEGHTDAEPVKRGHSCDFVSNWELSGARAAAVTRAVLGADVRLPASPHISSAVEQHKLQLLAVGLADTRPAVGALCARRTGGAEFDRQVCDALSTHDDGAISVALSAPPLDSCRVPAGIDSCSGSSDSARLCRWANWCADADGTLDVRRGFLRRVDLRIELEPHFTGTGVK